MAKCIVVADDLTGANATGVLLKKNGFDTLTLLHSSIGSAGSVGECDCLVFPTDSRSISPEEAYHRVREALVTLPGPETCLYAKRIDSTLRGNLGSETDAFLDTLGPEYIAVCVPCFPSSGRVIVGSHLLVNGVPLRRTEAAADPKCPIHTTDAFALFQGQTKYTVSAIRLDDVHNGAEHLATVIADRREKGARIMLVDSVTEDDLQTVAKAVALSGIKTVSVDPGPFTAYLGRQLIPVKKAKKAAGKVFCSIGSVNGVAGTQTRMLLAKRSVTAVFLDTARVLESDESRAAEIERLKEELLRRRDESDILAVIGCGIDPKRRVPFEPYMERRGLSLEDLSEKINTAFAEVTLGVLAACPEIGGVYSTGGDITAAIHSAAGTVALRLLDEVLPLAGYGIAIGGKLSGKAFVSKGGMVGGENAMVVCTDYLSEHLG
jgi:uncharacterized protein YgbK (DUF1537 family)